MQCTYCGRDIPDDAVWCPYCGAEQTPPEPPITKADLFALGLTGGTDSGERRRALLRRLELPEHLTANGLLEALNLLYGRSAFLALMAGKDSADGI